MKIFLFLSFLVSSKLFAYDAVVIVLEAPLLKEAYLTSIVLQTVRKGERIYVPNEIGNLEELPAFIQTYDRVGNIAYVPSKYIKIITHDLSEAKMPIAYPKSDPTDYRLEEPIPVTYPYDNNTYVRASFAISKGNNMKAPFDYNSAFSRQSFSTESGGRLSITRKIEFDKYDRYYFGFLAAATTTNNSIAFSNNNSAEENRSILRLGPVISFDVFKNAHCRLTSGTGFTYNYHKSSLKMSGSAGSEERLFSGYSFSPIVNTLVQVVDIIPLTDFVAGVDLSLYLPFSQKTNDESSIPELWGADSPNVIKTAFSPQVSFFLGFQVRY